MNKLIITTTLIIALANYEAFAQSEPFKVADGYKIEIKTSAVCIMCKRTMDYDLAFEKGVKSAELDVATKVMTVVYNPKKTNPDILRERITKIGYHADNLLRDSVAYENLPFCCKDGAHADDHDDDPH